MTLSVDDPARLPETGDLLDAAARIRPHVLCTPVLESHALNQLTGARLYFKAEHLQRSGAFKFRGACNAVWALDEAVAERGVATQSSGNHGAAIAMACRLRGIPATVVVPEGAPQAKLDNIAAQEARIVRCAANMAARDAMVAKVIEETGATLIHPFDNRFVIAGQGTATLELLREQPGLDALIVPVGGGGLISGATLAAKLHKSPVAIYGAEPEGARDAHDALEAGAPITDRIANTICDGLRGHLAPRTFAMIRDGVRDILLVDDDAVRRAMTLLYTHLKQVVEPSSAITLAAVLSQPALFRGQRIGLILSGGNVDLHTLSGMFADV